MASREASGVGLGAAGLVVLLGAGVVGRALGGARGLARRAVGVGAGVEAADHRVPLGLAARGVGAREVSVLEARIAALGIRRSEERRVGKECRSRGAEYRPSK